MNATQPKHISDYLNNDGKQMKLAIQLVSGYGGEFQSWRLSPVCQHRPEPLDFEITYKSGQSGAHYAKTSDTDRIQSGAESFLRKTHPSRVYARV